jgi:hypothetical protein
MQARREEAAPLPDGEKLRFFIKKAVQDWGDYGPQAKFTLEVLGGQFAGETIIDWASLVQPRLNFVANLREKKDENGERKYTDEKIAEILRDRGFEFARIDEPEDDVRFSENGKFHKICLSAYGDEAEKIHSFDDIDDLIESLVGRSLKAVTKRSGNYTKIAWDMIYVDDEAAEETAEEDFENIPF